MRIKQPTHNEFLESVANHQMKVIRDSGIYRHIHFSSPDDMNKHFDLITYPDHLVYSGDMGCYVFKRSNDMFRWFYKDELGCPDVSYREEKLQASSVYGDGHKVFCSQTFADAIRDEIKEQLSDLGASELGELSSDLIDDLHDKICNSLGEESAREEVYEFNCDHDQVDLDDSWEVSGELFTGYFIWACYAIEWGVKKYFDEYALRKIEVAA